MGVTREALATWNALYSMIRPGLTTLPIVLSSTLVTRNVHLIVFCDSSLDTLASVGQTWIDIGACAKMTVLMTHRLSNRRELV